MTTRRQDSLGATLEPAHHRKGHKWKRVVNCRVLLRCAKLLLLCASSCKEEMSLP